MLSLQKMGRGIIVVILAVVSGLLSSSSALAETQPLACPEPLLRAGDRVQVASDLASVSGRPQSALAELPATITQVVYPGAAQCPVYKLDLDQGILTWSQDEVKIISKKRFEELSPLHRLIAKSNYVKNVLLAYAQAFVLSGSAISLDFHTAAYEPVAGQPHSDFAGLRALARHAALTAKKLNHEQASMWFQRWIERGEDEQASLVERHFALFGLGIVLYDSEDFQGASAAFARAVRLVEGAPEAFHPDMLVASRVQLARSLTAQESFADAITSYNSALRHLGKRHETGGITRGQIQLELADVMKKSGDLVRASDWYLTAIKTFTSNGREGSKGWAAAILNLARLRLQSERYAEADRFYRRATSKALSMLSKDPGFWGDFAAAIAIDYQNAKRSDRAIDVLQQVLTGLETLHDPPRTIVLETKLKLGKFKLGAARDLDEALADCSAISDATPPAPPRLRATALICTGETFILLGMPQEAERAFLQARTLVRSHLFSDLVVAIDHGLSLAYQNAGRSVTSQQQLMQGIEGRARDFADLTACSNNFKMARRFADRPIAGFQYLLQMVSTEINAGRAFQAHAMMLVAQQFWKECLKEAPEASLPLLRLAALFEHKSGNSEKAEQLLFSALSTAIEYFPEWLSLHSGIAFDLLEFADAVGNDTATRRFLYLATAWALAGEDRLQLARSLDQMAKWYHQSDEAVLGVFFAKVGLSLQQSATRGDFVGRALRARSRDSVRILIEAGASFSWGKPLEAAPPMPHRRLRSAQRESQKSR